MSEIDVQNAKQIRDPMDVLIKMEVPEDVSVAYSGYSSSTKVSDAVLDERSWPMRVLADLQGDGFPLNGSCQLYDPTVEASASNGKIGIRGNVGEDLSITITGDGTINGMSIMASGTNTVRFNGQTATIVGGQVIIPVGADSITLEFPPLETDERVEVSLAMPGTSIQVSNDSIISCIVSLRSDLNLEEPTLPESEINIEIYNDVDISEVVATIQDDTPITYSAGYQGDMSEERSFYVEGQVSWADNVLNIHAVDAVHFLDQSIDPVLFPSYSGIYTTTYGIFPTLSLLFKNTPVNVNVPAFGYYHPNANVAQRGRNYRLLFPRVSFRTMLAFLNNVMHIKDIPSDYSTSGDVTTIWFSYVDGGIPHMAIDYPTPDFDIYEDDCGEMSKAVEPKADGINLSHKSVQANLVSYPGTIGSIEWNFESASYTDFTGYAISFMYYMPRTNSFTPGTALDRVLPTTKHGRYAFKAPNYAEPDLTKSIILVNGAQVNAMSGQLLFDNETPQNRFDKQTGALIYSRVIPWDAAPDQSPETQAKWWTQKVANGAIDKNATSANVEISGFQAGTNDVGLEYGKQNGAYVIDVESQLYGEWWVTNQTFDDNKQLYPNEACKSLLDRSNIKGSFTWKGDPRMQPRDVVNFHRLDGSVETITLENITLHHEGGGTYAEITYRKGVC